MSTETTAQGAIDIATAQAIFPRSNQVELAIKDVALGLLRCNIWLMLGWQDIKQRYARSLLGPFWFTLSMAITVYSMGFLYSHLFRMDLQNYFPFLTAGMLAWTFISTMITDLTETYIASQGTMKQVKLPYTLYVHRVIYRNFIIFAHNVVVMIPVLVFFHQSAKVNFHTLLLFPALCILYLNAFLYGTVLAIISTRFRDLGQIIKSLIQVVFFVTPIMWNPSILPARYQFIAHINPFYALVQLVRSPLLGTPASTHTWLMVFAITLVGLILSSTLFIKYRSRIIHWA